MDRPDRPTTPSLQPLARELAASERLQAFAEDLRGAAARVSEPGLPPLLGALHLHLGRSLLVLLPEDADARDAAEGASWYLGEEQVALFPSRGVGWDSGLEPPPHLVGERARALDVLAAGGLVCASAAALAEGSPPPEARPARLDLVVGGEPGIDSLAEQLALAGYERVERVEERGQFAVRGGIVDVFPTTGRDPLRIELFGDEIEAIRAFSPFTQRALRPVDQATVYPAAERRLDLVPTELPDDEQAGAPDDLVPPIDREPDLVFEPEAGRAGMGRGVARPGPLRRRCAARFFPARAGSGVRGAAAGGRCPRARRGRAGACLLRPRWTARRGGVSPPGRRTPHRQPDPPARGRLAGGGRRPPRGRGALLHGLAGSAWVRLARPRARPAARHADLPQAGAARATPGSDARSSRSPTCAPGTSSSTRTTASGSCSASRRRRWRGSRATTCSSPSAARTASTCRTSRSARSRATSAPTARGRRCPSSAARHGFCSRAARASRSRSSPAS